MALLCLTHSRKVIAVICRCGRFAWCLAQLPVEVQAEVVMWAAGGYNILPLLRVRAPALPPESKITVAVKRLNMRCVVSPLVWVSYVYRLVTFVNVVSLVSAGLGTLMPPPTCRQVYRCRGAAVAGDGRRDCGGDRRGR